MIVINDQLEQHLSYWDDDNEDDNEKEEEEEEREKIKMLEKERRNGSTVSDYVAPATKQSGCCSKSHWSCFYLNAFYSSRLPSLGLLSVFGATFLGGILVGRHQKPNVCTENNGDSKQVYWSMLWVVLLFIFIAIVFPRSLSRVRGWGQKWLPSNNKRNKAGFDQNNAIHHDDSKLSAASQTRETMQLLARMGLYTEFPHDRLLDPKVLHVLRAFEAFFQELNNGLERLAASTSLELGLGIWSPAVDRVERNHVLSSNVDNERYGVYSPGNPPTVRKGLANCLLSLLNAIDSNNDNRKIPAPVTLSWLKLARKQLLSAMSIWIDEHFIVVDSTGDTNGIDKNEVEDLQHQLQLAQIYCQELFFGSSLTYNSTPDEVKKSGLDYPPNDKIAGLENQLARQLHAAEVSLWRHHHYRRQLGSHQQWQAFALEFHQLVQTAACFYKEIVPEGNGNIPSHDKQLEEDNNSEADGELPKEPMSFEDEGSNNHVINQGQRIDDERPANKTLVFSGHGSKSRYFKEGRKTQSQHEDKGVSMLKPFVPSALLFQELKGRLSSLELAEEVDVKGDTEENDLSNKNNNNHDTAQTQTNGADSRAPRLTTTTLSSAVMSELFSSLPARAPTSDNHKEAEYIFVEE